MPEHGFPGRYRGKVTDDKDPLRLGRLRLRVPDVLENEESNWALPGLLAAGPGSGVWALPPVGAFVWVEFEQGDVDFPVWTGGWWHTDGDVPDQAKAGDPGRHNMLLRTVGGTFVLLSDAAGSDGGISLTVNAGCSIVITDSQIQLKARSGARIVLDDSGITLDNEAGATITLDGPTVSVNHDALAVT